MLKKKDVSFSSKQHWSLQKSFDYCKSRFHKVFIYKDDGYMHGA